MMQSTEDLERRLGDMVEGFDALMAEMQTLRSDNQRLNKQFNTSTEKHVSTPAATENGDEREKVTTQAEDVETMSDRVSIQKARDIASTWRASHKPKPLQIELPDGHPQVELEQDFTTPGGTQGRLGCPFAAMMGEKEQDKDSQVLKTGRKGKKPGNPSARLSAGLKDPIAAEFHSSVMSSHETSRSGSVPKCPIRFLDQHKPEEVAQYFDNHKHEIPRSHEVCIRRYQSNEQSIRQLDAKYGNLVSMIQGLGKKHQPMLEEKAVEGEESGEDDNASQVMSDKGKAKIEMWAGNVDDVPAPEPPLAQQLDSSGQSAPEPSGERKPRFDRELREVRLGESPSRPWGIQVPAEAKMAAGVSKSPQASPTPAVPSQAKKVDAPVASSSKAPPGGMIVFKGPVFFGYSADETARLLQQVPELSSLPK